MSDLARFASELARAKGFTLERLSSEVELGREAGDLDRARKHSLMSLQHLHGLSPSPDTTYLMDRAETDMGKLMALLHAPDSKQATPLPDAATLWKHASSLTLQHFRDGLFQADIAPTVVPTPSNTRNEKLGSIATAPPQERSHAQRNGAVASTSNGVAKPVESRQVKKLQPSSSSSVPARQRSNKPSGPQSFAAANTVPMQPADDEGDDIPMPRSSFMTGGDKYALDEREKNNGRFKRKAPNGGTSHGVGQKKARESSNIGRKFVSPVDQTNAPSMVKRALKGPPTAEEEEEMDPRLKGCDPKLVEMISNEIIDHSPQVKWNDIAGLEFAKKSVQEIVVWPLLRPDLFTGLRGPPKGILLFGPPGTGKTLIGKAIASEANAQFFSISASSLTSKWHGEGEKLVKTLFAVARTMQPAVIFIDEIDSLLAQRQDGENEASRRIKTEFLVQLDGAATEKEDRVLVVGATNRPQELDEAARRRLVKKLYIPLPEAKARKVLVQNLLKTERHDLIDPQLDDIVNLTKGYSGADMKCLCTEAAFGPLRSVLDISQLNKQNVRPINHGDFVAALKQVRASVSGSEITQYLSWNESYGSFPMETPKEP